MNRGDNMSRKMFLAGCSILLASLVAAAVPSLINFQGRLTNLSGAALSGSHSVTFTLWNVASGGGAPLFTEVQTVTADSDGIYNVYIGSTTALRNIFNQDLWLELTVDGETLSPRYRLTSSPYSLRAAIANDVPDNTVTSAKIAGGA